MGKQFVLPGAIVCTVLTCFQAGCKGQHVGDIMSQLVPGGHVLVTCFACPDWGQDGSAGQLECAGSFPQQFV